MTNQVNGILNHTCIKCGYKWSCFHFRDTGKCEADNLVCGGCSEKDRTLEKQTHLYWQKDRGLPV